MAYQRISWSPGRPVPLGTQVLEKTWRTNPANFGKHNTKNNSKSNPKNPSSKIWKSYMEIQSENLPSDPPFCFFSYIDNRALVCIRQSAAAIIHGTKNGPPRISVTGKNRLGPSFSVWEAIGMFEINIKKKKCICSTHQTGTEKSTRGCSPRCSTRHRFLSLSSSWEIASYRGRQIQHQGTFSMLEAPQWPWRSSTEVFNKVLPESNPTINHYFHNDSPQILTIN